MRELIISVLCSKATIQFFWNLFFLVLCFFSLLCFEFDFNIHNHCLYRSKVPFDLILFSLCKNYFQKQISHYKNFFITDKKNLASREVLSYKKNVEHSQKRPPKENTSTQWWKHFLQLLLLKVCESFLFRQSKSRDESRAAATSKVECFVIIVNGLQPLTIITKRSILDVASAIDPPLSSIISSNKVIM